MYVCLISAETSLVEMFHFKHMSKPLQELIDIVISSYITRVGLTCFSI